MIYVFDNKLNIIFLFFKVFKLTEKYDREIINVKTFFSSIKSNNLSKFSKNIIFDHNKYNKLKKILTLILQLTQIFFIIKFIYKNDKLHQQIFF